MSNPTLHMRTIQQASDHFKAQDPGTALTQTAIRRLVVTGAVPSIRLGRKYLINLEALESYLTGTTVGEHSA